MRRYQIIPMVLAAVFSAGGGGVIGYAIGTGQEVSAESADMPAHYLASTSPPALSPPIIVPFDDEDDRLGRPRYRIGTDHGFVAVFYVADDYLALKERTRTPESALSSEERERLADGVYIYTEEQLVRALQDYGS